MLSSWGLRSRLVLLMAAALVPVFGLFAWSAASQHANALRLARSTLQSQALLVAAAQLPLVEAIRQLLGDLASAPAVKARLRGPCDAYLGNLKAENPQYPVMGVLSLDGTVLCHTEAEMVGADASARPFFKRVMQTRQFSVGEYGTARYGGNAGVGFAAPVQDASGTLVAVAFAVLGVETFTSSLSKVAAFEGVSGLTTDRNGTLLAVWPEVAGVVGALSADTAVRSFIHAPRMGVDEAKDAQGHERVYAFASVGGAARDALFVAVTMPRESITAAPARELAIELAVLLAAALFGLACAWAVGRRLIVHPATAMLRQAEQLASGNLAARIEGGAAYQGELGHLAKTFNKMAESLQLQRNALDDSLLRIGKERGMLDLIINSMSEGVLVVDVQGRFLVFNPAAKQVFPLDTPGTSLAQWRQGYDVLPLDGSTVYAPEDRPMSRAIRGESVDNWDVLIRRAGAKDRVLRNNVRPLHDETGELVGGLVVFTDITERKFTEDFVRDQEQVLELIAYGVPLPQSLEAIVRLIESRAPGSLCSVLLCEGAHLRHGAAPSLPEGFNRQVDGLEIGEGGGACGTAAFRKKPVVVTHLASDPLMRNYRELGREFDLQSCWSTPVLSAAGDVLATFAIYHHTPYTPQPADQDLVDTAVRLARIAIERSRAEQALISSKARFRELAENIKDVFYNRDFASGRFLYISPAYETLWHRRREELYAAPDSYRASIHPDDRDAEAQAKHQQATGATTDLEYRIVRPGGEVRWIRDRSYPVLNEAGLVERIVGTARDITGRKRTDRELARTNRALQMLSRCNEALTRMDEEVALLLQICRLAVDVGGYRMAWVGYAQDDALRSILPMAHAGHNEGYLSNIQLTWDESQPTGQGPAGQTIRSGEVRISDDIAQAANHFHWHEAAAQQGYRSAVFLPLRDTTRTFGLLGLYSASVEQLAPEEIGLLQSLADNLAFGIGNVRSRLERTQAQEEVVRLNADLEERVKRRTAQLLAANQELEAFSYSVSHDLRTPLSAIDGFSGLLARDIADGGMPTARGKHYLSRIRAGVVQMGELIDALLSLAQVSRTSLRWDEVNLSALATAILNGYRERDPARSVQLQVEPDLCARGDPRLLQQVLDNLLGNAWKFSAGLAQTRISFGRLQGGDGQAVYVVRDNGAGFDMAYSEKLFGAFQRLHTVTEFEGTGIGLATVHRIVLRHGGRIWAESAPGQGATFYFTLGELQA